MTVPQAVIPLRTEVLSGKRRSCRRERLYRDPRHTGDASGYGGPRHKDRPLRIHQRLQCHVPEGIQRVIQADRQTDADDTTQFLLIQFPRKQCKSELRKFFSDISYAHKP